MSESGIIPREVMEQVIADHEKNLPSGAGAKMEHAQTVFIVTSYAGPESVCATREIAKKVALQRTDHGIYYIREVCVLMAAPPTQIPPEENEA